MTPGIQADDRPRHRPGCPSSHRRLSPTLRSDKSPHDLPSHYPLLSEWNLPLRKGYQREERRNIF